MQNPSITQIVAIKQIVTITQIVTPFWPHENMTLKSGESN